MCRDAANAARSERVVRLVHHDRHLNVNYTFMLADATVALTFVFANAHRLQVRQ
jgi:hypothetical protein